MEHINKKTLAEEVAERLRHQISSGQYEVGDKLPIEPELMKAFGVGRSSIREAIKLLTISGLLTVRQGLGTFVASTEAHESLHTQMSRSQLADVFEVRALLEVRIAEKAAANRTGQQLAAIGRFLKERKTWADAGDIAACIRADVNFHVAIAEACGNPVLAEIYKAASIQIARLFTNHHSNTDSFKNTQQLHEDLYKWIELKNPENAAATVASIINIF